MEKLFEAADPAGLSGRYGTLVDDEKAFAAALQRPLPRFAWTNTLRITPPRLAELLGRDGFAARPLPWHTAGLRFEGRAEGLGNHWTYLAGLFHIQEASAMLPALLLDPRAGERILDLCAAPGNKTAQLALALENRGTVVANDVVFGRLAAVRAIIDRLGLLNVSVTRHDGITYPKTAGQFDRVLVDVPCSCEGTSRKIPDAGRTAGGGKRRRLPHRQRLLLKQAVRRCRTGGRIVYATCTYAPEENEAVVDALLRESPEALRVVPARIPGLRTEAGITSWRGVRYHPELRHTLRIWPHHNDTGGFYMALLEKTGDASAAELEMPAVGTSAYKASADLAPPPAVDEMLTGLRQRFGIPEAVFAAIQPIANSRRRLHAAAADHRPPRLPDCTVGLPLLHLSRRMTKLTTAAAAALGPCATRGVVDVDMDQLHAYLGRRPFALNGGQSAALTTGGHVLVRYAGHVLGLGRYRPEQSRVDSFFPKRMTPA